jgi:predicted phage terminase large subunit-like protein
MGKINGIDVSISDAELLERIGPYGPKFAWFIEHGYKPHLWQALFHTMETDGNLTRFRHLVAGRRGGKTLSAVWEVIYYCIHPEAYWHDFHGIESSKPLWVWVLSKDYKTGTAARIGIRTALKETGLKYGTDYKENKGDKFIEFSNDSFLEFKTADDPQSLRGAGLHILWIDEAGFITSSEAWEVVSPSLADNLGALITTTTPLGKNWYYQEWWTGEALNDPDISRVEYMSIENPHFPQKEWVNQQRRTHPLIFKREYMASFDSMAGLDLQGDWLQYYNKSHLEGKKLFTYMGVDPAVSLSDNADHFSMALLGVEEHTGDAYLLEQYMGRIPFPEQVQLIQEWHLKYRPQLIGVEATAYQAALEQQVSRLSSMPPVLAITAKGKKSERILSMAPLFRIGKIKIRNDHADFINQWVDYNSSLKNPNDDALDSVEIALRTAGVLLPELYEIPKEPSNMSRIDQIVQYSIANIQDHNVAGNDEVLGMDW